MGDPGLIILSPRCGTSLHSTLLSKIAASLLVLALRVSSSLRHPPSSPVLVPHRDSCFLPLFGLRLTTSLWFKKWAPEVAKICLAETSRVKSKILWPQETHFRVEGFTQGPHTQHTEREPVFIFFRPFLSQAGSPGAL